MTTITTQEGATNTTAELISLLEQRIELLQQLVELKDQRISVLEEWVCLGAARVKDLEAQLAPPIPLCTSCHTNIVPKSGDFCTECTEKYA